MRLLNFLLVIAAITLVSCNTHREKVETSVAGSGPGAVPQDPKQAKISYKQIHESILGPKCVTCHGQAGGVNLETYAAVLEWKEAVYNAVVVNKSMPMGSTLSDELIKMFEDWYKSGTPELTDMQGEIF